MGAIFPVLDKEIEGIDISSVSGRMINRFAPQLDEIAKSLGVSEIMSFFGANPEDYFDEDDLGEFEIPEEYLNGKWFDPKDGIETFEALLKYLSENPLSFDVETNALVNDLKDFEKILRKAEESGAKWHVEIEI